MNKEHDLNASTNLGSEFDFFVKNNDEFRLRTKIKVSERRDIKKWISRPNVGKKITFGRLII